MSRATEEVSRCIIRLLIQEPFYGHLLGGVVRRVTDVLPTAGVALTPGGIELRVNPTFFLRTLRRQPERVAVIKHEALHLLFKHLYRIDPERRDPLLYNVAADLVVNQFIGSPWKLPESAIVLKTFPDLGLEPNETAEQYYDKLLGLFKEMEGAGWQHSTCDECSDMPDFSGISAPRSARALAGTYRSMRHSIHDGWAATDPDQGGSDAVRQATQSELDRLIIQARDRAGPRHWGALPAPLRNLVDALIERRKPKVNWKRALRLFATTSRRTRIIATTHRESRRFDTFPGIKVKRFQRLAVAIDTSGSISNHDLTVFFAEIHGMWRQGAEVTIIECDAQVHRSYPYKGILPTQVAGRGGTAFDPVFQMLRANRLIRYDGCIYLTDGYAPTPTIKPPCRLIWVVTSDGKTDHLKYGRVLKIDASG